MKKKDEFTLNIQDDPDEIIEENEEFEFILSDDVTNYQKDTKHNDFNKLTENLFDDDKDASAIIDSFAKDKSDIEVEAVADEDEVDVTDETEDEASDEVEAVADEDEVDATDETEDEASDEVEAVADEDEVDVTDETEDEASDEVEAVADEDEVDVTDETEDETVAKIIAEISNEIFANESIDEAVEEFAEDEAIEEFAEDETVEEITEDETVEEITEDETVEEITEDETVEEAFDEIEYAAEVKDETVIQQEQNEADSDIIAIVDDTEVDDIADKTFDDKKIDIMGFYNTDAETIYNDEPISDSIGDTQVFVPLDEQEQYLSEDGYVDAPEYSDNYDYTPVRPVKKKKRGRTLKTLGMTAALLVVVAGLASMISSVAFRVMGLSQGNDTSSAPLYNYSSSNSNNYTNYYSSGLDDLSSSEFELIGFGDSGDTVMAIQTRLSELGYLDENNVTSIFDAYTQSAVREFQYANGLNDSGAVDAETYDILFSDDATIATTTTTVTTTTKPTKTTTKPTKTSQTEPSTTTSSSTSSNTSSSTSSNTSSNTSSSTSSNTSSSTSSNTSSNTSSDTSPSVSSSTDNTKSWLPSWS